MHPDDSLIVTDISRLSTLLEIIPIPISEKISL